MKLSISLTSFKKNHKLKKNQLIYATRKCSDYARVENLFNFLLVEKNSFIFESVEKGKIRGEVSEGMICAEDEDINEGTITEKFEGKNKTIKEKPLNFLNNTIDNFKTKVPKGIPAMAAMLVGYFSYDIIRYLEKIPNTCHDDLKIPDVRLSRPRNLIIYDNLKKKIFYIRKRK